MLYILGTYSEKGIVPYTDISDSQAQKLVKKKKELNIHTQKKKNPRNKEEVRKQQYLLIHLEEKWLLGDLEWFWNGSSNAQLSILLTC